MGSEADFREAHPLYYWQEPANFEAKGLTTAYWRDPWPELQGILTSEHIQRYHDAVGRMIRPFGSARLKTASYELTLGPRYLVENEEGWLSHLNPRLRLPPNSLSFVSMEQVLLLPHYLVGRFDLAIAFIYQGLLLGTGPQVDPGFQGGLSCPLHNISNEAIIIELGQPFAKIDFAKTVPRPEAVRRAWRDIETEDGLRSWVQGQPTSSSSRLFKGGEPEWRQPIFGFLGVKRPTSSVKRLQTQLSRLQNIGWVALLATAVAILLAVPVLVIETTGLATTDLAPNSKVTKLESDAAMRDQALDRRIRELQTEVRRLRRMSQP